MADHYADQDLFNELPTVSKLDRIKYEEFLIVTGKNTHYLLKEPTVLNCPYHDWDNSDAEGIAIGHSPIKRPRVKDPRTIFVSSEQHHCSHRDVQSAKSSQITSANRDRCGQRSGKDNSAFCEIWQFEEHLCYLLLYVVKFLMMHQ